MVDAGFAAFSTTVDRVTRILKEIEQSYSWPKERRNQSYAALRSVLHALRDRVTVDEAASSPASCRCWSPASSTTAGIPVASASA